MSVPNGHNAVNNIDADIAVTLTPAEALGVNIAARLPDDVRVQLLAWIDQA